MSGVMTATRKKIILLHQVFNNDSSFDGSVCNLINYSVPAGTLKAGDLIVSYCSGRYTNADGSTSIITIQQNNNDATGINKSPAGNSGQDCDWFFHLTSFLKIDDDTSVQGNYNYISQSGSLNGNDTGYYTGNFVSSLNSNDLDIGITADFDSNWITDDDIVGIVGKIELFRGVS